MSAIWIFIRVLLLSANFNVESCTLSKIISGKFFNNEKERSPTTGKTNPRRAEI